MRAIYLATIFGAISIFGGLHATEAHAAQTLWVNDVAYGGVGGGFYWDTASGLVWTAERGWHVFGPNPPRNPAPLWVNLLSYGSAGGGFYWDSASNMIWTAETGWEWFDPIASTYSQREVGERADQRYYSGAIGETPCLGGAVNRVATYSHGVWTVRFTWATTGRDALVVQFVEQSGRWHVLSGPVLPDGTPKVPSSCPSDSAPTSPSSPSPTSTPTRSAAPLPTPTAPPALALTTEGVVAIVNSVAGPSGTGLPNRVSALLYPPGSIIRLFINEYLPSDEELPWIQLSDTAKASYARAVFGQLVSAYPLLSTSMSGSFGYQYLYLTIWSSSDWDWIPSFLFGTGHCQLKASGLAFHCSYPEYKARIKLPSGVVETKLTPWDPHEDDYWVPVP